MNTEYPKDPIILLSWTNTKLRDYYSSLHDLCLSLDIDRAELESRLGAAGFEYDPEHNAFR